MRIGFASEASIVSPKNLSHAYDSSTFQELEGDLKAHAIADKTSSTKHCPQPRGPRFHRSPSHPTTQKPHSSEGERRNAGSAGIQFGICTRNVEELYPRTNKTHVLPSHAHHLTQRLTKQQNLEKYTSRTLHTDHSTNMVEEPKLDIRRKRMCSVT